MKQTILAGAAAVGLGLCASTADAATFTGFDPTTDIFFDDAATFDYDPGTLGGSIFDSSFIVDITLSGDLSSGFLTQFDAFFATVLDGALLDTMLTVDGGAADDNFSMLFDLSTGATPFAIASFTGDLDGGGLTDFLADGVSFVSGNLTITGATSAVIPLPAGLPLLLGGLLGLGWIRRKSRA